MSELSPSNSPQPVPPLEIALEEHMERVMASTASPMEEAMAREITGAHLDKMLDLAKQREENRHKTDESSGTRITTVALLIFLFVGGMSWLALAFGHSEIVVPVISAMVGLAGGFGLGRASKKSPPSE